MLNLRTPGKSIAQQKATDEATIGIIHEGASLSQLASIFEMDVRKVKGKLHGLAPVKLKFGHPIYKLKDAAARLVPPQFTADDFARVMSRDDIPIDVQKEYWAGMRSKQIYQIAAGDLWATDKVIELMSEMLKAISMGIRLITDTIDRTRRFTAEQREMHIQLVDETLINASRHVEKVLEERKLSNARNNGIVDQDADEEL